MALVAPRRYGKTSLIRKIAVEAEHDGMAVIAAGPPPAGRGRAAARRAIPGPAAAAAPAAARPGPGRSRPPPRPPAPAARTHSARCCTATATGTRCVTSFPPTITTATSGRYDAGNAASCAASIELSEPTTAPVRSRTERCVRAPWRAGRRGCGRAGPRPAPPRWSRRAPAARAGLRSSSSRCGRRSGPPHPAPSRSRAGPGQPAGAAGIGSRARTRPRPRYRPAGDVSAPSPLLNQPGPTGRPTPGDGLWNRGRTARSGGRG